MYVMVESYVCKIPLHFRKVLRMLYQSRVCSLGVPPPVDPIRLEKRHFWHAKERVIHGFDTQHELLVSVATLAPVVSTHRVILVAALVTPTTKSAS